MELAAIDASAPWSINRDCNATIGVEVTAWDEAAMVDACSRLAAPTLIVHRAKDPRAPSAIESLAQAIPNAELSVVDEFGHVPWLERPEVVVPLPRAWLERLDISVSQRT